MSISDKLKMITSQGGICPICQEKIDFSAHIDHDHKTMKVRGVLCRNCNVGIGFLGDDPQRIIRAALYLDDRLPHMDFVDIIQVQSEGDLNGKNSIPSRDTRTARRF